MPLRTFIALELDDHILDGLRNAQSQLADPADKINWVGRDNLHVTLKFLGDVAETSSPTCAPASAPRPWGCGRSTTTFVA